MNALLDAVDRWGPAAGRLGSIGAIALVLGGFGLGVAHGTASAVAYAGAAGALILLLAVAYQGWRREGA